MIGSEPKISIIVPVYKVEPYLRKCLDSIVNQTYRNLQVILVDDGSPDNCGRICDEYAAKDSRIEVIHQENGGLSAARNAGLRLATGDYIGFVDSDDWIELDMYEYLLENALKYQADIAVCGHKECSTRCSINRGVEKIQLLYNELALELLISDDVVQNFVWDKLYKSNLFHNIEFPEGRNYEDIAIMYKLFISSSILVFLPESKYNYLQRSDSILADISLNNRMNYYWAAKIRYEEMFDEWPQFRKMLAAKCVGAAVSIWSCYLANSKSERLLYDDDIRELADFCQLHYKAALEYMHLGITGRMILRLTPYNKWWAFALASFFSWLYKLKHGRNL